MIVIYWLDKLTSLPGCHILTEDKLSEALVICNDIRNAGHSHVVTMAVENSNMVGSRGVAAVVDGKLPNGESYDWKKRRI